MPSAVRERLRKFFSLRIKALFVVLVLALTVGTSPPTAERYGDRLQIALPMLAWGCEALNGRGAEYFLRYVVMFTTAHATKRALGGTLDNIRPNGSGEGMPSAHTSTAVMGASSLVQECLVASPVAQGVVLLSAGFVGASRIQSNNHDIWQVLCGALLGWICDRALRRAGRGRRAIAAVLSRAGIGLQSG